MTKVLIRGYANDEYFDGTPCLCVDLDKELATKWLERIRTVKGLKEADRSVHSLDFWAGEGDFFLMYGLETGAPDDLRETVEGIIESLEAEEMVVLDPESPAYAHVEGRLKERRHEGGARIRTETDLLEVTDTYVVRCGYVKHSNVRLETVGIQLDDLAGFAGGLKVGEIKPE